MKNKKIRFSKRFKDILSLISSEAGKVDVRVFLVGGSVRDLILGNENQDIDVVAEGDAIALAERVAGKIKGKVFKYRRFGTATLILQGSSASELSDKKCGKIKIDFATARKETYSSPAALPDVVPSVLKNDLYRRDFTINSMAIGLNKDDFGAVIDHCGGLKDLEKKKIRILHDRSFIDDPTRIFRAIRFEQRLGFKIEKHTMMLLKNALGKKMISRTGKERIKEELMLILKESVPEKSLLRMKELAVMKEIYPGLSLPSRTGQRFKSLRSLQKACTADGNERDPSKIRNMYLMILLGELDSARILMAAKGYVFSKKLVFNIFEYAENKGTIVKRMGSKKRMGSVEVREVLNTFSSETLFCVAAGTRSLRARKRIVSFEKDRI